MALVGNAQEASAFTDVILTTPNHGNVIGSRQLLSCLAVGATHRKHSREPAVTNHKGMQMRAIQAADDSSRALEVHVQRAAASKKSKRPKVWKSLIICARLVPMRTLMAMMLLFWHNGDGLPPTACA